MKKSYLLYSILAVIVIGCIGYLVIKNPITNVKTKLSENQLLNTEQYNNTIPNGFKVIESEKETIISDENGNEFVWIPVDGKKISLSRKTFKGNKINNVEKKETIDRVYYGEESPFSCLYKYKKDDENYSLEFFEESVRKYRRFLHI